MTTTETPTPKKLLPKVATGHFGAWFLRSRRRCHNCKHFNWEAGQSALQQDPTFIGVMEAATPDRLGRRVHTAEVAERAKKLLDDGVALEEIPDEVEEALAPTHSGAQWVEFGACWHHEMLVWRRDVCEDWK